MRITLRAARINCGFTLKEVEIKVNKGIDTLSKYEKNSGDIPHDLLQQLLDLYDVSINNIFFGIESDFIGQKRKLIMAKGVTDSERATASSDG